jgi:hypothetical protein
LIGATAKPAGLCHAPLEPASEENEMTKKSKASIGIIFIAMTVGFVFVVGSVLLPDEALAPKTA